MKINPEANEIDESDLQAAADYYDERVARMKKQKRQRLWDHLTNLALILLLVAIAAMATWIGANA